MKIYPFKLVTASGQKTYCFHCKVFVFFFILSAFLISVAFILPVKAESDQEAFVQGKVTDFMTNLPLTGVKITVRASRAQDMVEVYTDSEGRYNATVVGGGYYYLTAWMWAVNYTYAPYEIYQQLDRGQSYVFDISLRQGAAVNLKGACYFLDNTNPPEYYRFTVLNAITNNTLGLSYYYPWYGNAGINSRLGIPTMFLIVPANIEVGILVEAYQGSFYSRSSYQSFRLKELISLPNGVYTEIDITNQSLAQDLKILEGLSKEANELLNHLEGYGFFLSSKKQDLAIAEKWIENSGKELYKRKFTESYSDMRQAFLITENTLDSLTSMQNDANYSTYFITFFMLVTSTALAYFFFEKNSQKKLYSLIFYSTILGISYYIYPGYRLINFFNFLTQVSLSLFFVFLTIALGSLIFVDKGKSERISIRGAIGAAFSIAKRNLRRRKLNCITMIVSLIIFIAAFIDLTSVSVGYGFSKYLNPKVYSENEGIFIRPGLGGNPTSFMPVSSEFISSLSSLYSENISTIAPKAENQPIQIDRIPQIPLGVLSDPVTSKNISIFGVLGISPNEEEKTTHIDRTLVSGRYLTNDDSDVILVSIQAVHELNVSGNLKIGDRLQFIFYSPSGEVHLNCTLVGLMDDTQFSNIIDLNGDQIIPKVLYPTPAGYTMRPADSNKIIVINYATISNWPGIVTSRVNVLCKSVDYINSLATQIVLTTPYNAWITVKGQSYLLFVGRYVKSEGSEFLILFVLVMLNIVSTMLIAIENRKNEMVTLATVGLNPSHILAVFISEALVVGLLGGGMGYFFGILGYTVMNITQISLAFEPKISFSWSIASVVFAIVVSIISTTISTLKVTKIVTPSFKGRWNPEKNQLKEGEYWETDMPIKIMGHELNEFVNFVYIKMKDTENNKTKGVRDVNLRKITDNENIVYEIDFNFISGETVSQPINTKNTLEIRKKEDFYTAYLQCKPSVGSVGSKAKFQFRETSLFTRSLLLLWGSQSFTIIAPLYSSFDHLISLIEKYRPKEVNLLTTKEKSKEIDQFIEILKKQNLKVPFFKPFLTDASDFNACLNKAKTAVKEAEIICVSGGTEQMNKALALEAQMEKKKVCYYIGSKDKKFLFVEFKPIEEINTPD